MEHIKRFWETHPRLFIAAIILCLAAIGILTARSLPSDPSPASGDEGISSSGGYSSSSTEDETQISSSGGPTRETSCNDRVDNDNDGLVDCDDADDCGTSPDCAQQQSSDSQ